MWRGVVIGVCGKWAYACIARGKQEEGTKVERLS